MQPKPISARSETKRRSIEALTALCHHLFGCVRARNDADQHGAAVAKRLEALESWHTEFRDATALQVVLWATMLLLHVVGFVIEFAFMANFAVFIGSIFNCGGLTKLALALLFALIGLGIVLGISAILQQRRNEGNVASARRWTYAGVIASFLTPLIALSLMLGVSAHHRVSGTATTMIDMHFLWLAAACCIFSLILIFSGNAANDAKAYFLFKWKQTSYRLAIARQRAHYVSADAQGVHAAMDLFQRIQIHQEEQAMKPALPPLNEETRAFVVEHFPRVLLEPAREPDSAQRNGIRG
jgi:hypothetical protein